MSLVTMNATLGITFGTSVESARYGWRAEAIGGVTAAAVRFLSVEPLLGPVPDLPLAGIDWVIAGGESGPGARPVAAAWVREVRDLCLAANKPFLFKQWGGVNKKKAGRELDGRTWDEMPTGASAKPDLHA